MSVLESAASTFDGPLLAGSSPYCCQLLGDQLSAASTYRGIRVYADSTFVLGGRFRSREGWLVLSLTRKLDQSLLVGEEVVVKIVGIAGNQVRLGIAAPKDVRISREQVLQGVSPARVWSDSDLSPLGD